MAIVSGAKMAKRVYFAVLSTLALAACAGTPPQTGAVASDCPSETGSHLATRTCSGAGNVQSATSLGTFNQHANIPGGH